MLELTKIFIEAWGCGSIETPSAEDAAPHEAHLLKLCIDKAIHELQWRPVLNSKNAIEWTMDWYKAWHERKADLRCFSINQITEFEMKSKVMT